MARLASLAAIVAAVAVPLGVPAANASLVNPAGTFGSGGSGAGQLANPQGVAIQPTSGNVLVADSGNARVDQFDATGRFISAFGWGVKDGKARSEVCTQRCQAGIRGSGPGQLSSPTGIAVSGSTVYVGDTANNVVSRFDTDGNFNGAIDGTSTPQGRFQNLAGIAVDQAGNLWTADNGTNNIDEFNTRGTFVRQWTDTHGSPNAIAADSANNSVYTMTGCPACGDPITERWSLTGQPVKGVIDRPVFFGTEGFSGPSASALALDPSTGNLYVDHRGGNSADVTVYDHNGVPLDDLSLGSNSSSAGLAFASLVGGSAKPGQHNLYVADSTNDRVTIYRPAATPGAPLITAESSKQTGRTTASVSAGIVPLGHDTTCNFQYVDYADFNASGYTNATTVPCTPPDLGSGFSYRAAIANLSGLTLGSVYHFRVIATNSAGSIAGSDQEFQAGPGEWASFFRCPVDDPAMLGNPQVVLGSGCLASNSTHGSITIGNITSSTGNTNLQLGLVNGSIAAVPAGGAIVSDPVQIPNTPVGTVTAVTQSAGSPSDLSVFAGIETGQPILTLPIKIQLENPVLGSTCTIGSDQNPILLHPENTDLSNAKSVGGFINFFDADGVPNLPGHDDALVLTGGVQGDNTFAVPGATGCGPNGSLDAVVNAVLGLPSPSGSNHLVLDDSTSSIALGGNGDNAIENGQQFAADWHVAFG